MPIIEKYGRAKEEERTIVVNGVTRSYLIHVPAHKEGLPLPAVLAFHGGGGTAQWMNRLTGLSDLADKEGFVTVYPQGIDRGWNDGRVIDERTSDDVGFATALIADLSARRIIDSKRVYATGISNGGFFSQYLAIMAPGSVRAVASVAATIPVRVQERGKPSHPVPILFFLGTQDPIIPFEGGEIAGLFSVLVKDLGSCLSGPDTLSFWAKANHCAAKPLVERLPDLNGNDGISVIRHTYRPASPRAKGSEVVGYIIEGGGHTWPSGWQYFQERYVGKTCRDIDASKIIWAFFARH